MASSLDARIERDIRFLYEHAQLPIRVSVCDGIVHLVGVVSSREMHDAVLELARRVDGVLEVDASLEYEVVAPDSAFEAPDEDREFGYADQTAILDDVSDTEIDFAARPQEARPDDQQAFDDAEPYSPPTDPVVRPGRKPRELQVIGGFQSSSMDELAEQRDAETGSELGEPGWLVEWEDVGDEADWLLNREDEDIRNDVIRELHEDSLTIDLNLGVSVTGGVVFLRGLVPTSDDASNAEDVAARVPGVVEVRDRTRVAGE
jgi:hypothetical protein